MLLHEARAHSVRVVMVTSAVSGEGKTSLACHLAVSMARAGHNALLVDGDLRNPGADRHFGLTPGPGLSELLRGEIDLATAVRPTPTGGAWIMTAGKCDLRAIQCLGADAMRSLFEQLRQQFDFVVVDSSPVLTVADPLLIGQHVDGVIFSVLCDVSRMPRMAAAQHRLGLLGIPTLGAVVIGTGETPYSPKYHWPIPDRDVFGVVASVHQNGGAKYPWSVPGDGSNQGITRNAG
jgi:capsular exopolysaccharide synthesis family protein